MHMCVCERVRSKEKFEGTMNSATHFFLLLVEPCMDNNFVQCFNQPVYCTSFFQNNIALIPIHGERYTLYSRQCTLCITSQFCNKILKCFLFSPLDLLIFGKMILTNVIFYTFLWTPSIFPSCSMAWIFNLNNTNLLKIVLFFWISIIVSSAYW